MKKINYTQTNSRIGFSAARKVPRLNDRKGPNIRNMGALCDHSTPGFWRAQKPILEFVWVYFILLFLSFFSLGEAKILIITHSFNRPDFIEIQAKTFKQFLQDEYEFVVFSDASDKKFARQIEKTCAQLGLRHIRIPQSIHKKPYLPRKKHEKWNKPSVRTSNAIQYSLDTLGFDHNDIVVIIDSDMFLVRPFSIRDYLQNSNLAAVPQRRGHVSYMWNGLIFLNMPQLPDKRSLNFNCGVIEGELCDSGGYTYFYLKNNPQLKVLDIHPFLMETIDVDRFPYLSDKFRRFISQRVSMEFLADFTFLHYRSGGNWNRRDENYHKQKTALLNAFIKDILQ